MEISRLSKFDKLTAVRRDHLLSRVRALRLVRLRVLRLERLELAKKHLGGPPLLIDDRRHKANLAAIAGRGADWQGSALVAIKVRCRAELLTSLSAYIDDASARRRRSCKI